MTASVVASCAAANATFAITVTEPVLPVECIVLKFAPRDQGASRPRKRLSLPERFAATTPIFFLPGVRTRAQPKGDCHV